MRRAVLLSIPALGLVVIGSAVLFMGSAGPVAHAAPVAAPNLPACPCAVDDAHFSSEDGGCKDLATGLVWSHSSEGDCSPGEPFQLSRQDAFDYCADLVEDGFDDWFLPSKDQLLELAANEGTDSSDAWHLSFTPVQHVHWSNTKKGNKYWVVNITNETAGLNLPSSTRSFLCARLGTVPNATAMHVQSIVPSLANAGKGKKSGRARVTVVDELGNPVSGAEVIGTFAGDFDETVMETTGSNGVATLDTTATAKGILTFELCVDLVTHPSLAYDDGSNVETCDTY